MIRASEFKNKEIINLSTNEKLGFLTDFEINSQTGFVEAFVVPDKNKSFLMSKKNGIRIPWTNIKGIGDDIILVDIKLEV